MMMSKEEGEWPRGGRNTHTPSAPSPVRAWRTSGSPGRGAAPMMKGMRAPLLAPRARGRRTASFVDGAELSPDPATCRAVDFFLFSETPREAEEQERRKATTQYVQRDYPNEWRREGQGLGGARGSCSAAAPARFSFVAVGGGVRSGRQSRDRGERTNGETLGQRQSLFLQLIYNPLSKNYSSLSAASTASVCSGLPTLTRTYPLSSGRA